MDGNLAMNSHFENMSEKDSNDMADHFIEEYAKKKAIAFAEWVSMNGWYLNKIKRWSNRNETSDNLIIVLSATKSTEELYTLFLTHQSI